MSDNTQTLLETGLFKVLLGSFRPVQQRYLRTNAGDPVIIGSDADYIPAAE
jgi:hypothetical protein